MPAHLAKSEPASAIGPRDRAIAIVAPDAHAALILDQAGRPLSRRRAVPQTITLLPLPPRSPERDPVENLWQLLRDNRPSDRVSIGRDDIAAHCCNARNELIDQPRRTRSPGRRACAEGL